MTATSLPSPKTVIADMPEVREFKSSFVYNFFVADEKINDSGQTNIKFIQQKSAEAFDANFITSEQFNRFAPRYVKFDWQPISETENITNVKISDNLDKVHSEQDFLSEFYTSYTLQDTGVDGKFNFFIKKFALQANDLMNPNNNNKSSPNQSFLDLAKSVNPKTANQVSSKLIAEALHNSHTEGHVYTDIDGKTLLPNQGLLTEFNDVKVTFQINNKFAKNLFQTIKNNSFSVFEDEANDLIAEAEQTLANSIGPANPNILDGQDYDFEVQEYVDYRPIDTNGYNPRKQLLGYLIDKLEIAEDGSIVEHQPVILESPNISTAVDLKVKYGATYVYSVRSVVYIESQAEDTTTGKVVVLSYLVSSKPSKIVKVECTEKVPPPVPSDLNVKWDYKLNCPKIEWNFPVNPQRDVKYFQIFRRTTIDEPFELIKFYDFDDSVVQIKDPQAFENIDPILVVKQDSPLTHYDDLEFKPNNKFIYTVCCVDAHGFSSNYGLQYEVSFNRFQNKIIKKLVSPSGAPKAYPNFYLLRDAFANSIKDSGHKNMKVIFNPEYLKVVNEQNIDLGLLKTKETDAYKISLINVDLQEQQNIEIKLNDKRTSFNKNLNNIVDDRLTQNNVHRFATTRKKVARVK